MIQWTKIQFVALLLICHLAQAADERRMEVTAIANNPKFVYSTETIYQELTPARLHQFLQSGKQIARSEAESMDSIAPQSLAKSLADKVANRRGVSVEQLQNQTTELRQLRCQGAMVTNGELRFWRLRNDWVLEVQNAAGETHWWYEPSGPAGGAEARELADPYDLHDSLFERIQDRTACLAIQACALEPAPTEAGLIRSLANARLIGIERFQDFQQDLLQKLKPLKHLEPSAQGALLTKAGEM